MNFTIQSRQHGKIAPYKTIIAHKFSINKADGYGIIMADLYNLYGYFLFVGPVVAMIVRLFLGCFLLAMLSGCAELPSANYDALRAQDTGDARGHLDFLRQTGEQISGTPFIGGNKVTLLSDGAAVYPAMLASIRTARHRIDMESFILDEQEGGRFADALLKRSSKGVDVNLIYNSIGSDDTPPELFDRLRAGGVHLIEYNPVDPTSIINSSFNHRDHRKLLIVDGKVAFTGGVNISEVYRLKLKRKRFHLAPSDDLDPDHTPWRDTQVKIEGPIVAEFERLFMQTWRTKQDDDDTIPDPPPTPATAKGDLLVQAIDGTPDLSRFAIYRSLLASIALAHQSIHITAAFFVPTPDLVHALRNAAERGVEVILILPSGSDPTSLSRQVILITKI